MQLRNYFGILFFMLVTMNCYAQKACPINFNKGIFERATKDTASFNGKIVAFNCALVRQETAYQGKPYLLVAVDGYIADTIWVACTMNIKSVISEKNLRVMGYFSNVAQDDTLARKYNAVGYHVLAMGLVNVDDKTMDMLPAAKAMNEEWIKGKVPKEVTR